MSRWNVLLVDDEEEFVSTLAERLRLRNIQAEIATDGVEALQRIDADPPEVVVLDVMMPRLGGLEVLRQISKAHPTIQVILLTGRGSTKEGIEGMRLGAFDYLIKPVKIEELIEKMSEAARVARASASGGKGNPPR